MHMLTVSPYIYLTKDHAMASASQSSPVPAPRDESLCRYPSKQCDNVRSEKRGGGLHRFCAFHRERANINQRRVDHRRRMRRRRELASPTARVHDKSGGSSDEDNELSSDMVTLDLDTFPYGETLSENEPLGTLTSEDLDMLLDLLKDEPMNEATPSDANTPFIKEESYSNKHEPQSFLEELIEVKCEPSDQKQ
ncbi:hypothetical protein Poli38472_001867 [Pythium oligandrum]|uniref:Uncharacterized protein n=1 Tax=Pythium oligandrum TaxID=41045 RepID=A0A8K1CTR3_PYTOL|nr:hypothetical protein Poli38472_001867 [Pythium oligandrum]|eukprot:TMW69711.1 hypothetical protein Poli38472_001867 [Pythium oligandrum]